MTGGARGKNMKAMGWPSDKTIVALSRKILVEHYEERNLNEALRFMADDMTWFGPLDCQRATSAQGMRRLIEPEYSIPVKLVDEEWGLRIVMNARVVIATYGAIVVNDNQEHLVFRQMATFVWGMTSVGPRVMHLHLANAYDVPPRLDRPALPSENAVEYALDAAMVPDEEKTKRLAFEVAGGATRYLSEEKVLCLDAQESGCAVVCDDGTLTVRGRLSHIEGMLGPRFVKTHRSCIVNAGRVVDVHRFAVRLDDGSERPIAERRYLDVVESLERAVGRSFPPA